MSDVEPTLRQLEYLVAVADNGTFVAAAEVLEISQPALSAQVAEAEKRLGVTVFERGRSGAHLTPEGASLVDAARRVLDANRELMRLADERTGDIVGSMSIGVIPTIAPYLLPVIVKEVRRRYPAADLFLAERRTRDLVRDIHHGDVDFGVLAAPVPELDDSLEVVRLAHEPFVLVTPETGLVGSQPSEAASMLSSLDGDQVDLDELDGLPMLLLEDGHCLREHAASACDVLGVRTFGTVQANGLSSLTQMVAAGMGVTLLPASAIRVEAREGSGLAIHHLSPPAPSREVVIAWRPNAARAPHYRVLAEALTEPVAAAARLRDYAHASE